VAQTLFVPVSSLTDEHLLQAARTSMSSKIIGKEGDFFAQIAVDEVLSVKTIQSGKEKYPSQLLRNGNDPCLPNTGNIIIQREYNILEVIAFYVTDFSVSMIIALAVRTAHLATRQLIMNVRLL
jgi:hypothetical protein